MTANDTKLAEQIAEAAWSDPQKEFSHTVAVIEGALAEWHCTDDAKGLNALMRLNKKHGDEIERLRAGCKKALEALDAWQDYSHRVSEDDGDEYDAQDCCGAFDRASRKTMEARKALEGGDGSE